MTQDLTGWETTRLSKHFILLDFLADHAVYRGNKSMAFDEIWNDELHALAKGLCNDLLEPLMMDERFGPISIADAFWPSLFKNGHHQGDVSRPDKHRWAGGEATVDIPFYRLVDKGKRGPDLKNEIETVEAIDHCLGRIISYPETEFVCINFKPEGAKEDRKKSTYGKRKKQNLRAHHVRVGRYFNLLDFCRSGRAVEEGKDPVPKGAENNSGSDYSPIPEETAARSFAAALDPLVEKFGRISVVRGIETAKFAAGAEHAERHRWDQEGPWRLVFVLPQETDPEEACNLLERFPHVQDVQPSPHPSDSWSLALIVDQLEYKEHCGLRPNYPSGH